MCWRTPASAGTGSSVGQAALESGLVCQTKQAPTLAFVGFWGHCGGSTGPFKRPSFILAQPPAVGRMIRERNLGSFELV